MTPALFLPEAQRNLDTEQNVRSQGVEQRIAEYLADLAACDPEDACFFAAMGEVIRARRLHGHKA